MFTELLSVFVILLSIFWYYIHIVETIRIPLQINPLDGTVTTQVEMGEAGASTTLNIGIDTGVAYSWFLHSSCTIDTSILNTELRQKLLVRSVGITRQTTVSVPMPPQPSTSPAPPLHIKYADGGTTKGFFVPNTTWRFKPNLPSQQHRLQQLTWGAATTISETVQQDQDLSHFERGNVDGWLGLGRLHPTSTTTSTSTSSDNTTTKNVLTSTNLFSSVSPMWSITFQLRRTPYSMVFQNLHRQYQWGGPSHPQGIKVHKEVQHWATVVRNVTVNGCRAINDEYNVLIDLGAGSIFTTTDMISSQCWKQKTTLFSMEFVMGNGKKVTVPHLSNNVSYHSTLRPKKNSRRQTIVLGLPFFMRQDVTLVLAKTREKKDDEDDEDEDSWEYFIDI